MRDVTVRHATDDDFWACAEIAERAYEHYIERIGRRPAPMDTDYEAEQRAGRLHLLLVGHDPAGFLVMGEAPDDERPDDYDVDNVAIHPAFQGAGLFTSMVRVADWYAHCAGRSSLYIYTNAKMTENLVLYTGIGFEQRAVRVEHGFERVYLYRPLFSVGQRHSDRVVAMWRQGYGARADRVEALVAGLVDELGLVIEQSSIGLRWRADRSRGECVLRPPELAPQADQ
jgi:ribosomal protein S18 acetylase RimI-like enzyme